MLALVGSLVVVAPAGAGTTILRDPAHPAYVVHLSTGPGGRTWVGREELSFTNLRAGALVAVWLRLWSNGVLGCGGDAGGRSSIEISDVRGGVAGAPRVNCTAVRIELDAPVPQGGRGTISMHVRIHVPKLNDRFGYHRHVALLGTALPTLAVRDDAGWHRGEPFVDLGESFYSIVGSYHVVLAVPRSMATPTTGLRLATEHLAGHRDRRTYAATDVRDFAWAAGNLSHIAASVRGSRVVLSYPSVGTPSRRAHRALMRSVAAMRAYDAALGAFPYKEMDVVLTSFATFSGMEYPTIVFANPGAISHEVAHQWWYGIVGDDEFHEPWLDEAFATWMSYVPGGGLHDCSNPIWPNPTDRITDDMGYWAHHPGSYGDVVYGDGACLLANLSHRFGYRRFLHVLRHYAHAHWFGVARTSEFRTAIEHAAAADGLRGIGPSFWAKWRVD
jgi:Peptidase family M1 domain